MGGVYNSGDSQPSTAALKAVMMSAEITCGEVRGGKNRKRVKVDISPGLRGPGAALVDAGRNGFQLQMSSQQGFGQQDHWSFCT